MRHLHPLCRPFLVLGFLLTLSAGFAGPALAKEGVIARLDAPVPAGAEPGSTLLVGFSAWVDDGGTRRPVEGTPFYVLLTARDGARARSLATMVGPRGHYTAAVLVPGAGITSVEIGIDGTTDLAISIDGDPLVDGLPGSATARVLPVAAPSAPEPAAAVPPFRGPAPLVAAPAAMPDGLPAPAVVGLAILAGLVLAAALRLSGAAIRGRRRPAASDG